MTVSHLSAKQRTVMAIEKRQRVADALDLHPEGMTADEIASATGLTLSELTHALDTLCRLGQIERVWRRT